jgi:hypothetical protein
MPNGSRSGLSIELRPEGTEIAYRKINVELIVFTDDAGAVVGESNA